MITRCVTFTLLRELLCDARTLSNAAVVPFHVIIYGDTDVARAVCASTVSPCVLSACINAHAHHRK